MQLGTLAVQAGRDATPFFNLIAQTIGKKEASDVTQADLDAMAKRSEEIADQLMLPISDSERQK